MATPASPSNDSASRDRHAQPPRIYVLAGTNGAGKSSIGGATLRHHGTDYFNPDEAAARIRAQQPQLSQTQANSAAWHTGKRLLERAIAHRLSFAFETTLGGASIVKLLEDAAQLGFELWVWYVGLASADEHIERVRNRVQRGGHDIPETDIRRRFDRSRINLVRLIPRISHLRVYDNTATADPHTGIAPLPRLLLHSQDGIILGPQDLSRTPLWARAIVAAAMKRAEALASTGHRAPEPDTSRERASGDTPQP